MVDRDRGLAPVLIVAIALFAAGCALPVSHYPRDQALEISRERLGGEGVMLASRSGGAINDSLWLWFKSARLIGPDQRLVSLLRHSKTAPVRVAIWGYVPAKNRHSLLSALREVDRDEVGDVRVLYFGREHERDEIRGAAESKGVDVIFVPPPSSSEPGE